MIFLKLENDAINMYTEGLLETNKSPKYILNKPYSCTFYTILPQKPLKFVYRYRGILPQSNKMCD